MPTTLTPTTATEIRAEVGALAPRLRERAAEIEAARQLPADIVDDLEVAGVFRAIVPRDLGGAGGDLHLALDLLDTLSRADASVGWIAMIGAGVWLDLIAMPRETIDALFADGPDVRLAGVFNPSGMVVATPGGYRARGRWSFASGCTHAQWIYVNCVQDVDGDHQLRTVLVPVEQVVIEDTWHVLGLRGTGSHHIRLDDVDVPAERTCAVFSDPPAIDAPIVHVPIPTVLALAIAAVAIGTAQGAVDDVAATAEERTPLLASHAIAADPLYHREVASARADLDSGRALLHGLADELWASATDGREPDIELRARARAAAVWAVDRAVAVVQAAYRAGGGGAVYDDSSLQRRLRDIHTLAQHFLVRPDTMVTAGAALSGRDLDVAVF